MSMEDLKNLQLEDGMEDYHIRGNSTVHCLRRLRGGGCTTRINISDFEPVERANDVGSLLEDYSVEGYWLLARPLIQQSGRAEPPKVPQVSPDISEKVLTTVLPFAILRNPCQDQRDPWQLLEMKALKWLAPLAI
jgi:hypothetical protein